MSGGSALPVVSVVTPVRDGAEMIAETIRSVLAQTAVQAGRVRLDYTIADGDSSDETVAIASEVGAENVRVVSRADGGMYDALAGVWQDLAPDTHVVAWLNAGDLWEPQALDIVLDVMQQRRARWVCGQRAVYGANAMVTSAQVPFRFRPQLVRAGVYGGMLPHMQQESTFWSGELMAQVDLERLRTLRLAGDQYLWSCFAQVEEPHIVEALLGGHRIHADQLSSDQAGYRAEALSVTSRPTPADRIRAAMDRVLWEMSPGVKKRANPTHLLRYDHDKGHWH